MDEGYKYCSICGRWVAEENKHCNVCEKCTSKGGRTYVHCTKCEKCVKPNWTHCEKCNRCAIDSHKCELLPFTKTCFLCNQPGHKKVDCPDLAQREVSKKRKLKVKRKNKTKKLRK